MEAKKRNRFWQLHSLLGIVLGLPLFIIFVAGTFAFFEPLAIHWLHPKYGQPPAELPALAPALDRLLEKHPDTDEITVVPAAPDHPVIDVYMEENHVATHYWLDPTTLEPSPATPHDADLFHFLVDLHYFNFIPLGKELTGIIAALFFTIILTGIVYQWRTIRRDAHPRNLSPSQRNLWKNFHRFTSLFTLPFQALYSVSGAALALGLLLSAPAVYLFFNGKMDALNQTLFPGLTATALPQENVDPFRIDEAAAFARSRWPADVRLRLIQAKNLGTENGRPANRSIILHGKEDGVHLVGTHLLTLDGNLNVLHEQTPTSHLAPMFIEGLVNVHFATFNTLTLKILFAAAGLVVSLSIAAGIYIFLQRRLQGTVSRYSLSTKVLVTLTHWMLGGLPLAIAISLHAAHWTPSVPVLVFVVVIALSLVATALRPDLLAWQAKAAAAGFLALPLTYALVHRSNPFPWGTTHDGMILLFNLFFIAAALGIHWLVAELSAREHRE